MKKTIAIAATVLMSATAAHASSVYTTAGSGDQVSNGYNSQVYEDDGVTMTVTAGLFTDTPLTGDAVVTPGDNGAHPVAYSPGTGILHDSDGQHLVDGNFPEVLILSFDSVIQLTGAVFSFVDAPDTFDLFADTNNDGILERLFENLAMPDSSEAFVDLLSYNLVGKLFGIGTSAYEYNCHDVWVGHGSSRHREERCDTFSPTWKLKKVKFEEVSEVPLPAALPLFMAGLAGFGFASRKKNA